MQILPATLYHFAIFQEGVACAYSAQALRAWIIHIIHVFVYHLKHIPRCDKIFVHA